MLGKTVSVPVFAITVSVPDFAIRFRYTPDAMTRFVVLFATVAATAVLHLHAQVEKRDRLPVPDIPGFRTLKGDFHIHTVFSDGTVWPTVRVMEAWRDGLDVIALTDHLEYRPYVKDVTTSVGRAYAVAKPIADNLGLILIPGVEITKPASAAEPMGATAHFNALFVTDADALNLPDLMDALRKAREQHAFVFWNHPGFRVAKADWFPAIAAAHDEKLFQGMELVNGPNFYPEAFPWVDRRQLTILGTSDVHEPMPPRERGGVRPITLLFARTADAAGVRDAFVSRRTAAWMGGELWGAEEHLRGLWSGAVKFDAAKVKAGSFALLNARNTSALPFRYVVRDAPAWFRLEPGAIDPEADSLVRANITSKAPAGATTVEFELELTNVHVAPARNLVVRVPLQLHISR